MRQVNSMEVQKTGLIEKRMIWSNTKGVLSVKRRATKKPGHQSLLRKEV
jgi:hypothetical protein